MFFFFSIFFFFFIKRDSYVSKKKTSSSVVGARLWHKTVPFPLFCDTPKLYCEFYIFLCTPFIFMAKPRAMDKATRDKIQAVIKTNAPDEEIVDQVAASPVVAGEKKGNVHRALVNALAPLLDYVGRDLERVIPNKILARAAAETMCDIRNWEPWIEALDDLLKNNQLYAIADTMEKRLFFYLWHSLGLQFSETDLKRVSDNTAEVVNALVLAFVNQAADQTNKVRSVAGLSVSKARAYLRPDVLQYIAGFLSGSTTDEWLNYIQAFMDEVRLKEGTPDHTRVKDEVLDIVLLSIEARMNAMADITGRYKDNGNYVPSERERAYVSPATQEAVADYLNLSQDAKRFYLFAREWQTLTERWFVLQNMRSDRKLRRSYALPEVLVQRAARRLVYLSKTPVAHERAARLLYAINRNASARVMEVFYEQLFPNSPWHQVMKMPSLGQGSWISDHQFLLHSVIYVPEKAGYYPDHITQAYPASFNRPTQPFHLTFEQRGRLFYPVLAYKTPVEVKARKLYVMEIVNDTALQAIDSGESGGQEEDLLGDLRRVDIRDNINVQSLLDASNVVMQRRLHYLVRTAIEQSRSKYSQSIKDAIADRPRLFVLALAYAELKQDRNFEHVMRSLFGGEKRDERAFATFVKELLKGEGKEDFQGDPDDPFKVIVEEIAQAAAPFIVANEIDITSIDGDHARDNPRKRRREATTSKEKGKAKATLSTEFGTPVVKPLVPLDRSMQVVHEYKGMPFLWATLFIEFSEMTDTLDPRKLYFHRGYTTEMVVRWLARVGFSVPDHTGSGVVLEGDKSVLATIEPRDALLSVEDQMMANAVFQAQRDAREYMAQGEIRVTKLEPASAGRRRTVYVDPDYASGIPGDFSAYPTINDTDDDMLLESDDDTLYQ